MDQPKVVERALPVSPWVVHHVTRRPARVTWPRTLAVLLICVVALLGFASATHASGVIQNIADLLDLHGARVMPGDRNGLIQPGSAR